MGKNKIVFPGPEARYCVTSEQYGEVSRDHFHDKESLVYDMGIVFGGLSTVSIISITDNGKDVTDEFC